MNDDIEDSVPRRYWWVNQGSTFVQAMQGGFIWAPQKSKTNTSLFHWENVSRVKAGDIIFHYSEGFIKAVSKAVNDGYESQNDLDTSAWRKEGWRADCEGHVLERPVSINKVGLKIASLKLEKGPVNNYGGVNQGYLYEISPIGARIILDHLEEIPFLKNRMQNKTVGNQDLIQGDSRESKGMIAIFESDCTVANLQIDSVFVQRFLSSLGSKRFMILTGLAGSGKTKLAQAFSRWICPVGESDTENPYYAVVPVGADWMGNENILGYANGLKPGEYVSKPALELILHATKHPDTPHFLILDEMNLSHVERYFADVLSAIESEAPIPLHNAQGMKTAAGSDVPPSVRLPENLFIIGTVNVDETTYMFSPKVLDRANVIEFRMEKSELTAFLTAPLKPDLKALDGKGAHFGKAFVESAKNTTLTVPDDVKPQFTEELGRFFDLLQKHNAEFGYRVAYEAARFLYFYKELSGAQEGWFDAAMDAVIVQKLLPKLHGSRSKLESLLEELAGVCFDGTPLKDSSPEQARERAASTPPRYPLSFEKVLRMWEKLVREQFVSFAEA